MDEEEEYQNVTEEEYQNVTEEENRKEKCNFAGLVIFIFETHRDGIVVKL